MAKTIDIDKLSRKIAGELIGGYDVNAMVRLTKRVLFDAFLEHGIPYRGTSTLAELRQKPEQEPDVGTVAHEDDDLHSAYDELRL